MIDIYIYIIMINNIIVKNDRYLFCDISYSIHIISYTKSKIN